MNLGTVSWMTRGTCLFFAAFSGALFAAGNPEAGKSKATTVCVACHGADGNSLVPTFPRLAGQNEAYLLHTLQSYKSGVRKNEIMKAQAALLSAKEMEDLAAYFSRQKGLETKR
jgi:cytochrome c553